MSPKVEERTDSSAEVCNYRTRSVQGSKFEQMMYNAQRPL
jgi:hypothetical protein